MRTGFLKTFSFLLLVLVATPSCMVLDGSSGQRKKNKCCGVIKCDMHRASQKRRHKSAVNASRSLKKKEAKIKRGY